MKGDTWVFQQHSQMKKIDNIKFINQEGISEHKNIALLQLEKTQNILSYFWGVKEYYLKI